MCGRKITCKSSLLISQLKQRNKFLSKCMIEKFQNCRLWNWPQLMNLKNKKQSSCAKNTHICLGANFDNFASCGQSQIAYNSSPFDCFWVQFDLVAWQTILNVSHLSSKVDVFNMDSTSMVCFLSLISTPCFHDWVITSFPKNARERFLLQCRTVFEWERVPRRTHFSFQKSAFLQNLLSPLSSARG